MSPEWQKRLNGSRATARMSTRESAGLVLGDIHRGLATPVELPLSVNSIDRKTLWRSGRSEDRGAGDKPGR